MCVNTRLLFVFCTFAVQLYAGPLHDAIYKDRDVEYVRELIAHGESVCETDMFGRLPLNMAVFRGRFDIAEILLANKARVNVRDGEGYLPLDLVVGHPRCGVRLLQLLLEHGAEVNALTPRGDTPFEHLGCRIRWANPSEEPAVNNAYEMARLLLLWGAGLNDEVCSKQLRGTNNCVWREILRKEHAKLEPSEAEHRQFMQKVEQDTNTSYAFTILCLLRDRQLKVIKAHGECLHLKKGFPKVLVRLVMDLALTDPQKRRLRKLEQQNQGAE